MARTAQPDPAQQPGPDPEADRITTIDQLKTEQDRQAGVLDELLSLVKGGQQPPKTGAAPAPGDSGDGGGPDRLGEIKQAIRDVRAEDAAADARAAHDAEHARLKEGAKAPEQQPRDAMPRGKARLQKLMFGGDT